MESFAGPVAAGVLVSLLNRYVLDFKWCTDLENWCEYADNDDDEDDESDMTPSSSTAISSDTIMTHHIVTHVH